MTVYCTYSIFVYADVCIDYTDSLHIQLSKTGLNSKRVIHSFMSEYVSLSGSGRVHRGSPSSNVKRPVADSERDMDTPIKVAQRTE
jgi:hypothetical protein